jgi:hypothetical protein
MENSRPDRSRARMVWQIFSTSKGISGMRITSAPPDTPELRAIHPA